MPDSRFPPLLPEPSHAPAVVNLILFSRDGCPFCRVVREHYLRPLAAQKPARLVLAEVDIDSAAPMTGWQGERLTRKAFAALHGVRFAPTVGFFDGRGGVLADAIVGLSNDFFGAYLDAAIARALAAAASR